jgi:hypothetical protein
VMTVGWWRDVLDQARRAKQAQRAADSARAHALLRVLQAVAAPGRGGPGREGSMTEEEWASCADPRPMLECVGDRAGDRKLRLFAAACCRRIWPLLLDKRSRRAVEQSERFADGIIGRWKLRWAANAAWDAANVKTSERTLPPYTALSAAQHGEDTPTDRALRVVRLAALSESLAERGDLRPRTPMDENTVEGRFAEPYTALLRDIIGNPFRPVSLDPAWLNPTVVAWAQSAYEDRALPAGTLDATRLAVLADALEEAGCNDAEVLAHLRSAGPHGRGCWPVDAVLGKE